MNDLGTLEKYVGSKEENLCKTGLAVHPPDFMYLIIENCNASKGVPFSKADITLRQYQSYRKLLWNWNDDSFIKVSYDQLFKLELIAKLATEGVATTSSEYTDAVIRLMDFFRDIQHHQEALSNVRFSYQFKSELTAAVAVHLLSQLTTGCKYEIDECSSVVPVVCPCKLPKCMRKLNLGCTTLGTNDTWHGRMDLIVNQQIPVFILTKDSDTLVEDILPGTVLSQPELSTEEYPSSTDSPPVKKTKQCYNDSVTANTREPLKKEDLIAVGVIDQIIALTITNSFTQISHFENLKDWLIPAFGFTSDHVVVFLYDSVNDILLQSLEIMPIWLDDQEKTFHPNTVVVLWMLINFQLFTKPQLGKKIASKKAEFFSCAQSSLASYQNMKKTSIFKSFDNTDQYLSYFRQRVVRARDKHSS